MPPLPEELTEQYKIIFDAVHKLRAFAMGLNIPKHELLFTPGDRLVGDLGEALAIYLFDLKTMPDSNSKDHDFICARTGTQVQIKTTTTFAKNATVGLGNRVANFEHIIVFLIQQDCTYEILYNGSGARIRDGLSHNATSVSHHRLRANHLAQQDVDRLPFKDKPAFTLAK